MYVTTKVTIAVAVSVMMKVTANVIVAVAPLDNESDPEILDRDKALMHAITTLAT